LNPDTLSQAVIEKLLHKWSFDREESATWMWRAISPQVSHTLWIGVGNRMRLEEIIRIGNAHGAYCPYLSSP
jgi:hypothetical protein